MYRLQWLQPQSFFGQIVLFDFFFLCYVDVVIALVLVNCCIIVQECNVLFISRIIINNSTFETTPKYRYLISAIKIQNFHRLCHKNIYFLNRKQSQS